MALPVEVGPARFLFADDLGGSGIDHGDEREDSVLADVPPVESVVARGEPDALLLKLRYRVRQRVIVGEDEIDASSQADDFDLKGLAGKCFLDIGHGSQCGPMGHRPGCVYFHDHSVSSLGDTKRHRQKRNDKSSKPA